MIRIGVICPSEVAFRRFMPALSKLEGFSYAGVAVNSMEERFQTGGPHATEEQKAVIARGLDKARGFLRDYGGTVFRSYQEMIDAPDVDAVYIPLPPALHYPWAKKALEAGKHVLVEKPAVLEGREAEELTGIAAGRGLALHENYMFAFHSQIEEIREYVAGGKIGDVRLIRVAFGFPRRPAGDFRYDERLGGGALLDCGGYVIRYASMLLGVTARLAHAAKNRVDGFGVDMYGSGTMENDAGTVAQISYGMDNDYRCELEIWGSRSTLYTNRVLTVPAGFEPQMEVRFNGEREVIRLREDDAFKKSIAYFGECVKNPAVRKESYDAILRQSGYVDDFNRMAG